jgi:ParB-like chromosome segregation protein Spo0J
MGMKKIKYPIKETNVRNIPVNRMLSVGITDAETAVCEKNIKRYGLLSPIVVMEGQSGEIITLSGENELRALKNMDVSLVDVFSVPLKDNADSGKIMLILSAIKKGLNAFTEGLVLKELVKTGGYTQRELAESLNKSEAWVSKRLSMAQHLKECVAEMVLSKKLFPRSAEEIAKIPPDKQQKFAMGVVAGGLPKSTVEKLVRTYNHKDTPETFKEEILSNPASAVGRIYEPEIKKCNVKKKGPFNDLKKLDSGLRLLNRLIAEIETYVAGLDSEQIKIFSNILPVVHVNLGRIYRLMSVYCIVPGEGTVSPGKVTSASGGVENVDRYKPVQTHQTAASC